jgi:hypothetical protein|tara:strand:- start:2524 stop:3120 length:597 start_codon:yes stop_codon:yes gene_type:complete
MKKSQRKSSWLRSSPKHTEHSDTKKLGLPDSYTLKQCMDVCAKLSKDGYAELLRHTSEASLFAPFAIRISDVTTRKVYSRSKSEELPGQARLRSMKKRLRRYLSSGSSFFGNYGQNFAFFRFRASFYRLFGEKRERNDCCSCRHIPGYRIFGRQLRVPSANLVGTLDLLILPFVPPSSLSGSKIPPPTKDRITPEKPE